MPSPHICRASVWPTSESMWIGPNNNCLARSPRGQLPLEVAQLHASFRTEQLVFITYKICWSARPLPATQISSADSGRGGDQHEAAGAVPGHLLSRPCSILSHVAAPHTAAPFFADKPARRTLCLQEASEAFAARVCDCLLSLLRAVLRRSRVEGHRSQLFIFLSPAAINPISALDLSSPRSDGAARYRVSQAREVHWTL